MVVCLFCGGVDFFAVFRLFFHFQHKLVYVGDNRQPNGFNAYGEVAVFAVVNKDALHACKGAFDDSYSRFFVQSAGLLNEEFLFLIYEPLDVFYLLVGNGGYFIAECYDVDDTWCVTDEYGLVFFYLYEDIGVEKRCFYQFDAVAPMSFNGNNR